MKDNKLRVLTLLDILKKKSDFEHKLSISQIITLLKKEDIEVKNRKTLYDDLKTLEEVGFEIEYDNGAYYLLEAPFSISEVKIILDSINALKSLDEKTVKRIETKLYSFISDYDKKLIEDLKYTSKHEDKHLINRLEDCLLAIKNKEGVYLNLKNEKTLIFPLFIHRDHDYYYLYYHYLNNKNLYHLRFDHLNDLNITKIKDEENINHEEIIKQIEKSTNSFYRGQSVNLTLEILNDEKLIRERLNNDFPNIIFNKKRANINVSISNLFFSKIVAYGKDIKIVNQDIQEEYLEYLKSILTIY